MSEVTHGRMLGTFPGCKALFKMVGVSSLDFLMYLVSESYAQFLRDRFMA